MARRKPLTASVSIIVDGEVKPILTIDENGKVVYSMPKDELIEYNKRMLKNVERAESDYYAREGTA